MKEFDKYWKENWNEYEWAGCERACRLCYEDAYLAGMLAAADLAEKLGDQWTEVDYHKYGEMTPSRSTGAEAIEFAIREAAK